MRSTTHSFYGTIAVSVCCSCIAFWPVHEGCETEALRRFLEGTRDVTILGSLGAVPFTGSRKRDQEKQSNSNSRCSSGEGTRHSEVVQCFKGLRLHPASNRRGCFCPLLGNHDGRLQVPQRRPGRGVRGQERPQRPSGRERYQPLANWEPRLRLEAPIKTSFRKQSESRRTSCKQWQKVRQSSMRFMDWESSPPPTVSAPPWTSTIMAPSFS